VSHHGDARLVDARPEGIEALVAGGAPAVSREDRGRAHHEHARFSVDSHADARALAAILGAALTVEVQERR
jgi:hypothetical protein